MKKIIKKIVLLLFYPFKFNKKLYFYIKDIIFTNCIEHFDRTISYLKKVDNSYPNFFIVDIGSSNGGSSFIFAEEFKNRKIIGFEPIKQEYEKAITNCKYNNVEFRNLALGREKSEGVLFITNNSYSSSLKKFNDNEIEKCEANYRQIFKDPKQQKTQISTLDDELNDLIGILLIKIDTQGTELEILNGGLKTLKKTKYILIEMSNNNTYVNGSKYFEIDEFLRKNKFQLLKIFAPWADGSEYDALYVNNLI